MKKFLTLILALTLIVVPTITTLTSCVDEEPSKTDGEEGIANEEIEENNANNENNANEEIEENEENDTPEYYEVIENWGEFQCGRINESNIVTLIPEEVMNNTLETLDIELGEFIELCEALLPQGIESSNMKWTFEVVGEEKLDDDACVEIAEDLESRYEVEFEITEAYAVSLSAKLDIEDIDKIEDEETRAEYEAQAKDGLDIETYAVKIDGKWYIVNNGEGEEDFDFNLF